MDIRCLKCKSKLYEAEKLTKINILEPLYIIKIKCRKCKELNVYFIPSCFNKKP